MKKLLVLILSIILLSSCGNNTISAQYQERLILLQESNTNLSETLSPAIVGILSTTNGVSNIGAGVCVAPRGIIITNSHVVNNADNIDLYLQDGTTINANTLYEDTVLDFAIIQSDISLPYLPININDIVVGDTVIAVGTPISLMLKHTFTQGIVSATNRTIKISTSNGEAYMQNLIQHDASLNPGNSGGPLLNTNGEVIGINTLKITSGEGIGFAIPCKSFASILNKISNNVSVATPYLGVYGYDAEIAKFNKLTNSPSGFFIEDINTNSPAYCILNKGDTITGINGNTINNASDLRYELNKYSESDTIVVDYISNNTRSRARIQLQKRK